MAPESKGESSKHAIERPGLREATMHASSVIISLVQEAADFAPSAELKRAASIALVIFDTIQAVKENKEAYKRLGDDSAELIVAIWHSFKKAESPKEWLSADMQDILVELTHILEHICSFVREKLARNKAMRVIYSRADVSKIAEYREKLNSAMQKFELRSHVNIDLRLGKLSEQMRHRNGEDIKCILEVIAREARDLEETERIREQGPKKVKKISTLEHLKELEIDHQAEDEREYSEELKKREKGKDRQSELERLRAAVRAVEMAKRLKEAEEEEMAELKRKIAAGRRSTPYVQPSKNKRSCTQKDEIEDEGEEKEIGRMKAVKTNPRRPPRRPHGALETFTGDEEPLRRSTAHRKSSNTPPHFGETEDQRTDEEKSPLPKKSPKVVRKSRIPPGSEVDDLMAQFQGFGTPLGSPLGSRSSSPMFYSQYGSPLPPSVGPDGYGYGAGMVVNTGVGNIANTIISNVDNDNSVKRVYRTDHGSFRRSS